MHCKHFIVALLSVSAISLFADANAGKTTPTPAAQAQAQAKVQAAPTPTPAASATTQTISAPQQDHGLPGRDSQIGKASNAKAAPAAADNKGSEAKAAPGKKFPMDIIIMVGVFVLMFFFMFRKNKKQQQERQEMLDRIVKGSKVLLASGIYGKIVEVKEKDFVVEIADNVRILVIKHSVASAENDEQKDGEKK